MLKRLFLLSVFLFGMLGSAEAYWIWTPKTGKWFNPKYAAKDTPEEQFDYALEFYNKEVFDTARSEFEKVIKYFPLSKLASESKFYIGKSYEKERDYYRAFLAYQEVLDKYPYTERVIEIVELEYRIANLFYAGEKRRLFGFFEKFAYIAAIDKAIEIFEKVIENSPYGKYAVLSQYKIGLSYLKEEEYALALSAFQRLIENYPESKLVDDAKYQIALVSAKVSLKSEYDQKPTEEALEQFKDFSHRFPESEISEDVEKQVEELKDKKANHLYSIAEFYRLQKQYGSAEIYYNEVIENYQGTELAKEAFSRLVEMKKTQEEK